MIGMAARNAGKAMESVRIPVAKVSSQIIPRVSSIARTPRTKASSTADKDQ